MVHSDLPGRLREEGIGMAVLGLLTIALGILLLLNSLASAVIFHRVYGFSLGVGEIAALIGGLQDEV